MCVCVCLRRTSQQGTPKEGAKKERRQAPLAAQPAPGRCNSRREDSWPYHSLITSTQPHYGRLCEQEIELGYWSLPPAGFAASSLALLPDV